MILKRLYLFLVITFYVCCSTAIDLSLAMQPQLSALLDNMKLYKLDSEGNPSIHAGDIYEN